MRGAPAGVPESEQDDGAVGQAMNQPIATDHELPVPPLWQPIGGRGAKLGVSPRFLDDSEHPTREPARGFGMTLGKAGVGRSEIQARRARRGASR